MVRKSQLIEVSDSGIEFVPLMAFSRFAKMSPAYLCRIKKNKVVVSERLYNKINTLLTNFRNNDKL